MFSIFLSVRQFFPVIAMNDLKTNPPEMNWKREILNSLHQPPVTPRFKIVAACPDEPPVRPSDPHGLRTAKLANRRKTVRVVVLFSLPLFTCSFARCVVSFFFASLLHVPIVTKETKKVSLSFACESCFFFYSQSYPTKWSLTRVNSLFGLFKKWTRWTICDWWDVQLRQSRWLIARQLDSKANAFPFHL